MKRPQYLLLPLFVFVSACFAGLTHASDNAEKPNILFVLMDDLGYGQFGANNDALNTSDFDPFFVRIVEEGQGYSPDEALAFTKQAIPTLTKLADEGIRFTNAYVSSSLCASSRLGIATGVLQNRMGVYENADAEDLGVPAGAHLAENLKEAGYKTAHIGKWHIGQRDKSILKSVLRENGLPEGTEYWSLKTTHPAVFDEVERRGYYGSVIESQNPLGNGFDYYYGYNTWASQFYDSTLVWENYEHAGKQEGYNTDVFTDRALDFIDEQVKNDTPFYVQLHYHAVHDSLEPKAPDAYYDRFQSDSFDLNNFYAHVYGVDENIRRIVEYLKSKDAFENTLIIFSADNGAMAGGRHNGSKVGSPLPGNAPFSGHKGNLYQGGIRVPFFVHWGDGIEESFVSDHLVSALDILPTAISAAGSEVPVGLDGKSLLPIFEDKNHPEIHSHLLWAGMHSAAWGFLIENTTKNHTTERPVSPPAWALVKGDYLLRYVGEIVPGVYKDALNGSEPVFELYNIKDDPAESNDLSREMPELLVEMSKLALKDVTTFPKPTTWDPTKWQDLLRSEELLEGL